MPDDIAMPNEQTEAVDAQEAAAKRVRRGAIGEQSLHPSNVASYPQVADDDAYAALEPGVRFRDPQGQVRQKPYEVSDEESYRAVPEGAHFRDPEGNLRARPTFEGVDYTAQTLYDMALTPSEKKKALERSYPGKVRENAAEGLYIVEDDGTHRKPGRGLSSMTGFLSGAAMPAAGAALGGLGGAAAGAASPVPGGAFLGGMGGAMSGGALGQWGNDLVLQLAGVYDRTPGEAAGNIALAGVTSGMGAGVGRGVATLVPSIKAGVSQASAALPSAVAHFVGARPAESTMARELAEKAQQMGITGPMVPPSAHMFEAPHVQNVAEVFYPAFHTENPIRENVTRYYDQKSGEILKRLGVQTPGSMQDPHFAPTVQKAGEKIRAKVLQRSQEADRLFREQMERERADALAGVIAEPAKHEALQAAAEKAKREAQALVKTGLDGIQQEIDTAAKASGTGASAGDLWRAVAEQIRAVRAGIQERAGLMYGQADELAGGHLPNSSGLAPAARDFLDQLPEPFQAKYPDLVKKLEQLAGEQNEAGEWVREPLQPTFGQLHNLRSQFRSNVSWYDLTPDVKDGAYKFFARRVDDVLHDPGAVPELKAAADQLDRADRFYREAMGPLNDKNVQAVVSGLESGLMPDPKALAGLLLRENRTELARWAEKAVGPNLWSAVRSADLQEMLDLSKSLTPGTIDGRRFVQQVLDRYRNGMLDIIYGREASARLIEQARYIEMLDGRLQIPTKETDTVTQVIARARQAADQAKQAAHQDPLGTLNREMKKLRADEQRALAQTRKDQRADPLRFLFDPTVGAAEAVEKILANDDLLFAAAEKFGRVSSEFQALRRIYVQKVLLGTMQPSERLAKISPEVQKLMFPGVTHDQMKMLAKEMDFLMNTRAMTRDPGAGSSMSAFAKVENPWGAATGLGPLAKPMKMLPGANPLMRATLAKYYELVTKLASHPATLRYIERGLQGNPASQAQVRQLLDKILQKGTAVGAGAAAAGYQGGVDQ